MYNSDCNGVSRHSVRKSQDGMCQLMRFERTQGGGRRTPGVRDGGGARGSQPSTSMPGQASSPDA